MEKIGTYVNGNTIVAIYDDGSKVRYVKADEAAQPEFPESIDLKITNRCNLGCPMCAECSTPNGKHADLNSPLLSTLRPYTELAVGGGNPLSHPDLVPFLRRMAQKKVICNITVNAKHFVENVDLLETLAKEGLIHGLGISLPGKIPAGFDEIKRFPNAVVHTIVGVTPIDTFKALENKNINLLILGLKTKGNGRRFVLDGNASRVIAYIRWLQDHILSDMRSKFKAIAFDNLAISQLYIKEKLSPKEYETMYMGDDGEFTMYIDLVENKFAASSTHELHSIESSSIEELFHKIKL